jgi:O-antigen/teichoic acid export membrane protein
MSVSDSPAISGAEARRAARNATAIAASSVIGRGVQFGWQLVLAPWLGVAAYGIYGTVGALLAVGASIANFGMGPIVIRDVSRYPDRAGKYLTATLFLQTLLALAAYIFLNAAGRIYAVEIQAYLALAAISLIVDSLGNLCYDLLLAQEKMFITSVITVVHILLLCGFAAAALLSGFGLAGVYVATIAAGGVRTLVLWRLVGVRPLWPLDRAIAWPLLLNSLPLAVSAFLSLAYQHADKFMTTLLIGTTGTGYLTAAFVIIFGVVELLNTTVLLALYPMMSRSHGDGRDPMFGFIVEKLAFFNPLVSLPIAITLSVYASEFTSIIFRSDFDQTAGVLRILIWFAVATMVAAVLARGLVIQNKQRLLLKLRVAGLVANILLNLLLLPMLGVQGAAIATLSAELLVVTLFLWNFHAEGWDFRRLAPRWLRLAALAAPVIVLMAALRAVHPVLGFIVGLSFYVAGVLLMRVLAPDDWDLLYRIVAAMPGGAFVLRYWRRDVKLNW